MGGDVLECIFDVLIWFDSLHLYAGVGITLIAYIIYVT